MKTNNIKNLIWLLIMWIPLSVMAQDAPEEPMAPEIVKATFENGLAINNQTVQTVDKGYIDFNIQHRFGLIDKASDLYGIYAPSNIRLFFGYGVTKKLSVGAAATKNKQLYDFSMKYKLLQQKTSGMPVSVTFAGNAAIKGGEKTSIMNQDNTYKFAHRMSYFGELMVGRKFNSKFSGQVGVHYAHYNMVDSATLYEHHDFYGVSAVARYKFSPQGSFMVEYDHPLNVSNIAEAIRPMPNLGLGLEFSTGYHQFQIFVCNSNGILDQEAKYFNHNDFKNLGVPGYLIGFNITRQFGLGE
ncbi:MAG: DUF5777 family beta-barrel protein [Bacteroidia bacterium]|nr:DUF5777 family beta-barrel protein [Bacteroidia bacterium]MCF8425837.1 DUF5777 family beta-barrel protein [Bacteroidia bacterium]MCF8447427.1 DUF5777 family beta-barrel protein [Bacteroidia bacterium]